MNHECYQILLFSQGALSTRHVKIYKKTFYLVALLLLFLMIFFCDYIQMKKQALDINRVRQETQFYESQIQFFTMRIEELEGQLSKLMDVDKRIRLIANLDQNPEIVSFIGTGGTPPKNRRAKLKTK